MMDIVTLVMACSIFPDYSITHAMIQVGSRDNYLMVTSADGNSTIFPKENQAVNFINQQIQDGNLVDIGVTQLPSRWLKTYQVTPAEIVKPCKNLAIASEIVMQMWNKCGHIVANPSNPHEVQACALSMYKTNDPQAGLDYAKSVMDYATKNPFEKIAKPAMEHWEKNAKVPKIPGIKAKKNNSAVTSPAAQQLTTNNTDDTGVNTTTANSLDTADTNPNLPVSN